MARPIQDYAVRLIEATHPARSPLAEVKRVVRYGSSPRGAQAVILAAKIEALRDGRFAPSFADVRRVLRPGAPFVCTFSNRCFPTKAIRGWLSTDDATHCAIVAEYFRRSGGWAEPVIDRRTPPGSRSDPLFAVWARRDGDASVAQ